VFVHGPPVLTVRDRVFHALFYRLALIYARAVPHQLRRVIEFALLFEVLSEMVVIGVFTFVFDVCKLKADSIVVDNNF